MSDNRERVITNWLEFVEFKKFATVFQPHPRINLVNVWNTHRHMWALAEIPLMERRQLLDDWYTSHPPESEREEDELGIEFCRWAAARLK
jgi:hypothetical protein